VVFDNACFLRKVFVGKEVVESGCVACIQRDVREQMVLHGSCFDERREK
jgi:hypothetical protein